MEWARILGPYVVCILFAGFFAWVITSGKGSTVAHIGVLASGAVLLLYLLIDTGRLHDIPPFRYGDKLIAVEQRLDTVEKILFDGYVTEAFQLLYGASVGTYIEDTPGDPASPWRIKFYLQHEPVPNSILLWENGLNADPQRIVVDGKTLTLRMYYDPRPNEVSISIRYFPRG